MKIQDFVVLDLETTGLSVKEDQILEIGAVKVQGGEVTASYETFVNPGRKVPERITELTGIRDEMIANAPDVETAVRGFLDFCGGLPLLGHNILFDYSFIKQAAINARLDFEKEAWDTLKIARKALPDLESRSLEALCGYYQIPREHAHRAMDDVLETLALFRKLEEGFSEDHPEWFAAAPLKAKMKREVPATEAQKKYLDFLRFWLKDKEYVALAYMTGILPIKKYGSHSALNMFTEYSMTDPGNLAEYFGFTETEVQKLCEKYEMNFEEARAWYNGYHLISHEGGTRKVYSMYSPKSVVEAMQKRKFGTYWNQTETYEALKVYIQMNMDGLKDAIVQMLAGSNIRINTGTFSNDMTTFATKDDVLTLLVHLGYLTYDNEKETVEIPNREVSQEYVNAISTMDWTEVIRSVQTSRELLEALWQMDSETVEK